MLMLVSRQRYEADCVLTALHMALNVAYEDVVVKAEEVIAGKRDWKVGGVFMTEALKIAALLGKPLTRKRKFDLALHEGVLWVKKRRRIKNIGYHAVVVRRGLLFEPADGSVWEPEVYFTHTGLTPTTLLALGESS